MARTLTAGATTAKNAVAQDLDILVESSDLNLHWHTKSSAPSGDTWTQSLVSISQIDEAVPPGGGLALPSRVAVQVRGESIALAFSQQTVQSSNLEVSILYEGETYANRIILFNGKIDQCRLIGQNTFELEALDDAFLQDTTLPQTPITTEDFPGAPTHVRDQRLPLVYGSPTPLVPLVLISESGNLYRVSDHDNTSIQTETVDLTGSLAHAWNMDEADHVTRVDSVGSEDLTDQAGTIDQATGHLSNGAQQPTTPTTGNLEAVGDGLRQDGDGDWTLAFWVQFDATNAVTPILVGRWFDASTSSRQSWQLTARAQTEASPGLSLQTNDGATAPGAFYRLNIDDTFVHVVLIWDDSDNRFLLQVNNDLLWQYRPSAIPQVLNSTTGAWFSVLGRGDGGSPAAGTIIDAMQYWTKALNFKERLALYNRGTGYQHSLPSAHVLLAVAVWANESEVIRREYGSATLDSGNKQVVLSSPIDTLRFGFNTAYILRGNSTGGIANINDFLQEDGQFAELRTTLTDDLGNGHSSLGAEGNFALPWGSGEAIAGNNRLQVHGRASPNGLTDEDLITTMFPRSVQDDGTIVQTELATPITIPVTTSVNPFRFNLTIPIDPVAQTATRLEWVYDCQLHEAAGGANDDLHVQHHGGMSTWHQADSIFTPLFIEGVTGRQDDGSGTYTGSANAAITHPVDILHNVQVLELGHSVNTTKKATAKTARSGWIFAGGIGANWLHESLEAREFLDMLAQHCGMTMFRAGSSWDYVAFDPQATSEFDFAYTSGHILDEALGETSLRWVYSPRDEIPNEFRLRYAWHAGRRDFAATVWCDSTGTNSLDAGASRLVALCNDGNAQHGTKKPFLRELPFIYDRRTAERLLDYYVKYWAQQQLFIEFDCTFQGVHLQLGDIITLTHPSLPTDVNGDAFQILGITYTFPATIFESPPSGWPRLHILARHIYDVTQVGTVSNATGVDTVSVAVS